MTERHLIVWQDHSSLANHDHLLLMIRVAYDRAVYHTPAEMHDLTGKKMLMSRKLWSDQLYTFLLGPVTQCLIN